MGRIWEYVRLLGAKRAIPAWILFAFVSGVRWAGRDSTAGGMIAFLDTGLGTAVVIGAGVLWITALMVHLARDLSRRRLIEVYPRQRDRDHSGRSLRVEIDGLDEVWISNESGSYYGGDLADHQRKKVTRMIMLTPDAGYIRYATRWKSRESIVGDIHDAIKIASGLSTDAKPLKVRLINAPMTNMAIGRKRDGALERLYRRARRLSVRTEAVPRWVRVQVFTSTKESKEWPNIVITRWSDKQTFEHLLEVYESMWTDTATISSTEIGLLEKDSAAKASAGRKAVAESLTAGIRITGGKSAKIDDNYVEGFDEAIVAEGVEETEATGNIGIARNTTDEGEDD